MKIQGFQMGALMSVFPNFNDMNFQDTTAVFGL